MLRTCYIAVSEIAICQRCPMLLAYKIHKGYKSAWRVGTKGSGDYYGSLFHKHIAEIFFNAASNPKSSLHTKILASISGGVASLEEMIREEIFMPFINRRSNSLTSGQITSMAKGVTTWVKAMYDFFTEIPSLTRDAETIFIKPEGKLQGNFDFADGNFNGRLAISGRYDALLFNTDKTEARLFEFKGLKKSDVTVPLSQTLIYAWLLYKSTGIIPSIEIIYLDEDEPIIFAPGTVRAMIISALPELFTTTFNIISLRKAPEILQDKELCALCKFKTKCKNETQSLFRKQRPASTMLSVLIFFMAAMMIMTQVFFFSTNSSESLIEDRELVGIRMKLASKVEEAKEYLTTNKPKAYKCTTNNRSFYKNTMVSPDTYYTYDSNIQNKISNWANNSAVIGKIFLTINDLDYTLEPVFNSDEKKMHEKIFAAMGDGYYLIRAYTKIPAGTSLMYQVLVYKNGSKVTTKSYEEIWY